MATETEKMIIAASRLLPEEGAVYVGTGMPLLASVLALKTHAPDLLLVYEGGGVGGKPTGRLPIQVSESLTYENGVTVGSMDYVMSLAQAGWIQYGFSAARKVTPTGIYRRPSSETGNTRRFVFPVLGAALTSPPFAKKTLSLCGRTEENLSSSWTF